MKRDDILFLFSSLLFLFAGLLYAWGPPAWFSDFPYTIGLRFLLSLEIYFLCCAFFFTFRTASSSKETERASVKVFCASFAAIPVFSFLVIADTPIQILQSFVRVCDFAVWLSILLLALRDRARLRSLFSFLFFLAGISLLVPGIPSIVSIAARLLLLTVFSIARVQGEPTPENESAFHEPADYRESAERFALSPRETEVLALLVEGKTNNEIAGLLFISLSTVKTHIASIFGKMGVRNRLEASAMCRKA